MSIPKVKIDFGWIVSVFLIVSTLTFLVARVSLAVQANRDLAYNCAYKYSAGEFYQCIKTHRKPILEVASDITKWDVHTVYLINK